MSGPLVILTIGILIFLIVRYSEQTKYLLNKTRELIKSGEKEVEKGNKKGWLSKHGWSILVTLLGGALLYWSLKYPDLDSAQIGELSQTYWIQILIAWGAIASLIWLNADEKKAGSLQTKVFWVVVILLVALPIWSWFTTLSFDSSKDSKVHQIQIPPLSDSVQVKVAPGEYVEWKYADFAPLEMHCVLEKQDGGTFEDGTCGSNIVRTYMKNLSNWPQIATYEIKKG